MLSWNYNGHNEYVYLDNFLYKSEIEIAVLLNISNFKDLPIWSSGAMRMGSQIQLLIIGENFVKENFNP